MGLRTRIVKHDVDFETNDKKYVRAQQLSDFWQLNSAEQIPDIILVEYPSISTASLSRLMTVGRPVARYLSS